MSEWILPQTRFQVELTMLSDWHVGSGAGRPGDIDRLIRRDPLDNLPFVPAKTLTGIWRDACERVAIGLDEVEEGGPWSKWVEYLFGEQPALYDRQRAQPENAQAGRLSPDPSELQNPRRAALSVRAAYLPEDLRQALKTKRLAAEAVTFVKPGVKIHPRTGRARQDHLRFEEMARAGARLTAECSLDLKREEDRQVASALLLAGAQMVERLGGKRRRGAGRCKLTVAGRDAQIDHPWLDWLSQPSAPGMPPAQSEDTPAAPPEEGNGAMSDWERIELTISPRLPVIVPSHTIGNLIETLDYIPSSYLLPIFTRKLNDAGVNMLAAIGRNALVVTNATLIVDGQGGRPVPLSIVQEKLNGGLDKGRGVYNRLCERKPEEEQTKSHNAGYVGAVKADASHTFLPQFDKPDLMVETHNVIKDEVQRPTSEVSGVFSYQSIAPLNEDEDTKEMKPVAFHAELRLHRDFAAALNASWSEVLNGRCKIGRAGKDDYGLVELKASKIGSTLSPEVGQTLTVWLLSDVLLRDGRLRPTASVERLGDAIAKELDKITGGNITLALKQVSEESKLISSAPKQRRTDSWQVQWGFPRPTLAGLQAGTCAVFEVSSNVKLTSDHLAAIELSGIGERRAEGYGQLCFNDPLVTHSIKDWAKPAKPENGNDPPKTNDDGGLLITPQGTYEYARLIEREAIRRELQRQAIGFAADAGWRWDVLRVKIKATASEPTMSQLGALRSVIAQLRSDKPENAVRERQAVLDWLARIQDSKNRERAWPKEALEVVRKLVSEPDQVWGALKIDFTRLIITTSEKNTAQSAEAERKQEMWAEAVRTVVDACVRAHKRELEKEAKDAS
jgi:CRISPR-associated protein Csx10